MEKNVLSDLDNITLENVALALWMKEFQEEKIPQDIKKCLLDDKNSPNAFGKRMQHRIQDLMIIQIHLHQTTRKGIKNF